jgi:guanylate kinase
VQKYLNQGIDVFLDIDWQGARQIRKLEPSAKSIFILPPSLEELEQRLQKRGQDSQEVIQSRMQQAQKEISHYNEYDYIIINDIFEQSLQSLWGIVNTYRHSNNYQSTKNKATIDNLLKGYKE